jgi:hypothetical protein
VVRAVLPLTVHAAGAPAEGDEPPQDDGALEPGVLEDNLGVPLVIVCNKVGRTPLLGLALTDRAVLGAERRAQAAVQDARLQL